MNTQTFESKEIRALCRQDGFLPLPCIVASGEGVLAEGTILGKVTASGKYAAYDNAASDGTQTAVGILSETVDATSADVSTHMYVKGQFVEAELVGLDANGKTDLGSKTVEGVLIL